MKITKQRLKEIIREELEGVLREAPRQAAALRQKGALYKKYQEVAKQQVAGMKQATEMMIAGTPLPPEEEEKLNKLTVLMHSLMKRILSDSDIAAAAVARRGIGSGETTGIRKYQQ